MLVKYFQKEEKMFQFKFIEYLINPKIFVTIFLLDLTGIMTFLNKYIFSDITYLKWLVIVMLLDLITGITKVWVNDGFKAITSKGLRDSLSKVIQYASFLIVTHVLTHYQVGDENNTNFKWLSKFAYEFLILIEIKSVYENLIKINPALDFVTSLINKIKALMQNNTKDISNKK